MANSSRFLRDDYLHFPLDLEVDRLMPGEIADMMLGGTLCEGCGEYLDSDDEMGIPMYCSTQCAKDRGIPKKDWPLRVVGYEQK